MNLIETHGENLFTTSLVIAKSFGRRHSDVLRAIDNLISSGDIPELNSERSVAPRD